MAKKGTGIRTAVKDGRHNNPGRPRTTLRKLPKDWADIMRAEATEGHGPTRWMVRLGIAHSALNTLLEDSEKFRNTYSECLLLCQDWWENNGREQAQGSRRFASAPVWAMNMTNRFNWRSGRNEVVGDPNAPLQSRGVQLNANLNTANMSKEEVIAALEKKGLPTSIFGPDEDSPMPNDGSNDAGGAEEEDA